MEFIKQNKTKRGITEQSKAGKIKLGLYRTGMHFIYSNQLNKMAKTHTLTTGSRTRIAETEILKQLNLFRIILFCVSCSSVGSLYMFLSVYIFDFSISERRHVCMVDVA